MWTLELTNAYAGVTPAPFFSFSVVEAADADDKRICSSHPMPPASRYGSWVTETAHAALLEALFSQEKTRSEDDR